MASIDDIKLLSDSEIDKMKLNDLKAALKKMVNDVNPKSEVMKLIEEVRNDRENHSKILQEVRDLRETVNELRQALQTQCVKDGSDPPQAVSKKLLIGDSTLRDIDSRKVQETDLRVTHGATVDQIKTQISQLKDSNKHYEETIIVVGKNDCSNLGAEANVEPVLEAFRQLVNEAIEVCDKLVVSSVTPRQDIENISGTIENVNAGLQVICTEKGVHFIDHTPSFTLNDGSINDGYLLHSGPHLTRSGTNKLVKNLHVKHMGDDVTLPPRWKSANAGGSQNNRSQPRNTHPDWRKRPGQSQRKDLSRCKNCYEPGHNIETCRHGAPVLCRSCGKRGHKDKHCHMF